MGTHHRGAMKLCDIKAFFNPLAQELFFFILAHSVYKM